MTADGDAPEEKKGEFANFLDDIAGEISQRVESLIPPGVDKLRQKRPFTEDRRVLDWANVVDRMIDELR